MNLRETIISSFFFHLILLLLMTAVANYSKGISGSLRNMVSVDLTTEVKEAHPPDPAEQTTAVSSPPSVEPVDVPDQPLSNSTEDSEKKAAEEESKRVPGPATGEIPEKAPDSAQGFTSLQDYYNFIVLHKRLFVEKAGASVNEIIGEALKTNKRVFYGGTGTVSLKFGPDRKLSGVLVDSASPELKAFLEEVAWSAVPAPAGYYIGFTRVQIKVTVLEGYLSFNIDTL